MKTQKFGVEIEFTGMTRCNAAKTIAKVLNGRDYYQGGGYDAYHVTDNQGRTWKVMRDASIDTNGGEQCELVTPVCKYEDIELIQKIVRELRHNGMKVNNSCGIHIHIDASTHTARSLKNLVNIMASKEDMLFHALEVADRREHYCKKIDKNFVDKINKRGTKDKDDIKNLWYDGRPNRCTYHYDESRYHALNLHAVWQKGTVEFRCFNSTTHAGKIKAYIQLCLAISNQAKTQKSASRIKTETTNEKFTFRTWLLRMGLIGDEFATCRQHLLNPLEGNAAWRNTENNRRAA